MKKNKAYFLAFLACTGIAIVWLAIFSLELGIFWQYLFAGACLSLIGITWRAITKKPKREAREEAVKNVDYDQETLIRLDEQIAKARRLRGAETNHDLIWILENRMSDRESAETLISKFEQAYNKDLLACIENISNITAEKKKYLIPFVEVGLLEDTRNLVEK